MVTDFVRLDDYIRYLFILVVQPIELDARHARRIDKNVYCQSVIYTLTISSVSVKTPVLSCSGFITGCGEHVRLRDHVSS